MEPPATHDELADAARLHQAGELDSAEASYRRILADRPDHPDATHLLGVLEHHRGRHREAIGLISRALGFSPSRADYRNNLGVALRASGQPDEAVAAHRDALRLAPDYPDALANLGVALHDLGRLDEARPPLEAALRLDPDHVNALFALANLLHDLDDLTSALPLFRRAHALAPGRADVLNNLGIALAMAGDFVGSVDTPRRAAEAAAADPSILAGLGRVLERLDHVEEAGDVFAAVARLCPREGHWPVRVAALCPPIFPDGASIDRYRIGLEAVLDAHRGGLGLEPGGLVASGCVPSFYLPHHGLDDLAIMTKFAALFRGVFPDHRPVAGDGPPHVGFVVTRGREGGFIRGMAGIVDGLSDFRVSVFAGPGGLPTLRASITRPDAGFVAMPNRLPEAAERIASARCDVLYHWQVGTDPLGYFLPFARPAPVQCTSWGTHVTSGIPAIDFYLSSELIEAPGSEARYSEELVRLATLPTYQPTVVRPGSSPRRTDFGLPEGRHLYACLQRLAKLHPDFDPLMADILRRDPRGLIVLLEDAIPRATELLRARLRATMPDVFERVVFAARRPGDEYLGLLSLADVALDPLPYGAGLTAYDILGLGVPLVTLPGDRHIGRYALGCYRKIGVDGPVAETQEHYVELATRLADDGGYRSEMSTRITKAASALFEDKQALAEHARFFERACSLARQKN